VLSGVDIQHESNQGSLEPGAGSFQHVEAAAGYLDAAFEVDNTQFFPEVPVGQRLKVKGFRFSPGADFHVIVIIHPDGDIRLGRIGHVQQ
jgi:hypothetical protein